MNWWMILSFWFFVMGMSLAIYGIKKKSNGSVFCSCIFLLFPIFIFLDWTFFLPMIPPIAMMITSLLPRIKTE